MLKNGYMAEQERKEKSNIYAMENLQGSCYSSACRAEAKNVQLCTYSEMYN